MVDLSRMRILLLKPPLSNRGSTTGRSKVVVMVAQDTAHKSVYGVSRVTCHRDPGPPISMSKVRGFSASKYVSEYHSKLKAFMSDSKWRKCRRHNLGLAEVLEPLGHGLTFDRGEKSYQWDMQTSHTFHTEGPVWYEYVTRLSLSLSAM